MEANWKFLQVCILLLVGLSLLKPEQVMGQQDPQYSHYMFNELNYNPAFAGNHNRQICATFLQHSQWVGFNGADGGQAPNTQVFNIHAPLNNDYVQGAGLAIFNDQQGFQSTVSVAASASHKREFSFGRLSVGLNVGIIQNTLDGSELRAIEENDPLIPDKEVSSTMLDLGFGAFLNGLNYYAGISGLHLNSPSLGYTSAGGSKYVRHFYLTGGYTYDLNQQWAIKPSTLLKYDGTKLVGDLNGRVMFQEKYWAGLGYRFGDQSMTGIAGLYLTPKLKVGYSFDLPFTPNRVKTGGSHEILIGYCFNFDPEPKEEFPIWTPRHL